MCSKDGPSLIINARANSIKTTGDATRLFDMLGRLHHNAHNRLEQEDRRGIIGQSRWQSIQLRGRCVERNGHIFRILLRPCDRVPSGSQRNYKLNDDGIPSKRTAHNLTIELIQTTIDRTQRRLDLRNRSLRHCIGSKRIRRHQIRRQRAGHRFAFAGWRAVDCLKSRIEQEEHGSREDE